MDYKLVAVECRAMSDELGDIAQNISGAEYADSPPLLELVDEIVYISEKLDALVDYTGRSRNPECK